MPQISSSMLSGVHVKQATKKKIAYEQIRVVEKPQLLTQATLPIAVAIE